MQGTPREQLFSSWLRVDAPAKVARKRHAPVGLAWFEAPDYQILRTLLDEQDNLPESFQIWHRRASIVASTLKRDGYQVVLVRVTPEALATWCAERNTKATFRACVDLAEAKARR